MTYRSSLVEVSDLRAFFFESLQDAARAQGVKPQEGTLPYLAGMLTDYSRTEHVFDQTAAGPVRPALALLYKSALESQSRRERSLFLQRLGDLALFIAGLFADSLRRGPVDVDYYIAMGGGAYASLCKTPTESTRSRARSKVFEDLASNFVHFVDLIGEVGEQARDQLERDVLRLHELWRRTGSRRLERKLRSLGIVPGRGLALH